MKFDAKEITLKNGTHCTLRSPTEEDAEAMLNYMNKASSETNYMSRYEDEITMSINEEKKFLSDALVDPGIIMVSVFISGELVANARLSIVMPRDKLRHRTELGIAIIKECWNIGLGSILMEEITKTAKIMSFEQIELEVDTENEHALYLYKKFGFELYGTRKNTFKYRDGRYSNAHLMLKKL